MYKITDEKNLWIIMDQASSTISGCSGNIAHESRTVCKIGRSGHRTSESDLLRLVRSGERESTNVVGRC